jgi:recombination protein RecA
LFNQYLKDFAKNKRQICRKILICSCFGLIKRTRSEHYIIVPPSWVWNKERETMATADLLTMAPKTGDRQKALDSALAQIERQFGKGSIMTLGEGAVIAGIEATSTGSIGLDIALGIGGLPKGRIIEIYGPESSGKTTLTLHCVAEEQKKGGVCAFVDAEHALDPLYMLVNLA